MFDYLEYKRILKKYKKINCDYKDVKKSSNNFCIIRHDVEFSLIRALKLARIEKKCGIRTSYFFQVISDAYNSISDKGIKIIREIKKMNHNIGLHLYVNKIKKHDKKNLLKETKKQILILEKSIGFKIDRLSVHRPPKWILNLKNNFFRPYIYSYDQLFFENTENIKKLKKIKYFSDSNHKWKYGHPLSKTNYSCFQILLHPDEWSEKSSTIDQNFKKLIIEENKRYCDALKNEYKNFPKKFLNYKI
jgi:hypothetical protein